MKLSMTEQKRTLQENKNETEAEKMAKITTFIREQNGKIWAIYNDGKTTETTAQELGNLLAGNELNAEATRMAQNIISDIEAEARKEKEAEENFLTCKRIGEELEKICAGEVYRCPHCGAVFTMDEIEDSEHEDEDGATVYTCPHCDDIVDEYDLRDNYSLWEYLGDNVLDIDFLCNREKEYTAAKICIAYGGPSIYIDTETRAVCLYWWGQTAKYLLTGETVDAVNDYAEELFND